MIFSRKNAGQWVASKGEKVIAASTKLTNLLTKVEKRKDKQSLRFDRVPSHDLFAGHCAI